MTTTDIEILELDNGKGPGFSDGAVEAVRSMDHVLRVDACDPTPDGRHRRLVIRVELGWLKYVSELIAEFNSQWT